MSDTMKAVIKEKAAPGAVLGERPIPRPAPGEVLLKIVASSICGTDHHVYSWDPWAQGRVHIPRVMGHECAGEVVELGQGVRGLKTGDLVSVETHITCGVCYACRTGQEHICESVAILGVDRDGSFADYLVIPSKNAWVDPEGMDPSLAAIQEPLGNAVHTVFAGEITGEKVAVVGCGPIGLMAIGVAKAAGAEAVFAADLSENRLELAKIMGADVLIHSATEDLTERLLQETGGHGVDVVLEMSGSGQALSAALKGSRNGARVSLLGLPSRPVTLDLAADVIMKGIVLQGITGRRMFDTWFKGRSLQESGKLDLRPIITHRMALREFDRAMSLLESGEAAKIVLTP